MQLTLKMVDGEVQDLISILKKYQYLPEIPQLRTRVHYRHEDGTRFFLESTDVVSIEGEDQLALETIRNISALLVALGWSKCRIMSGTDTQKQALFTSSYNLDIEDPEDEKRIAAIRADTSSFMEVTPLDQEIENVSMANMSEVSSDSEIISQDLSGFMEISYDNQNSSLNEQPFVNDEVLEPINDISDAEIPDQIEQHEEIITEQKPEPEFEPISFVQEISSAPSPVVEEAQTFRTVETFGTVTNTIMNFESLKGTLRLSNDPEIKRALAIIQNYFNRLGVNVPELTTGICTLEIHNQQLINLQFEITIK